MESQNKLLELMKMQIQLQKATTNTMEKILENITLQIQVNCEVEQ